MWRFLFERERERENVFVKCSALFSNGSRRLVCCLGGFLRDIFFKNAALLFCWSLFFLLFKHMSSLFFLSLSLDFVSLFCLSLSLSSIHPERRRPIMKKHKQKKTKKRSLSLSFVSLSWSLSLCLTKTKTSLGSIIHTNDKRRRRDKKREKKRERERERDEREKNH